jgi:hypothetical protein
MRFTVLWVKKAEQELAELWLNALDRTAITQASNRIDRILGRDPEQVGESREGNRRILVEPPLAVIFRVELMDRLVQVLHVFRFE